MRCYLFNPRCLLFITAFIAFSNDVTLVSGDELVPTLVNVHVYYESLCGDSMRWIRDQLVPSYTSLKKYLKITLIPYGKATQTRESETGLWHFSCQHGSSECLGNKAQACAIHAIESDYQENERQGQIVNLIGCTMSDRYPPSAVETCATKQNLKEETRTRISECIKSSLADDLLAANGDKTWALNPPLSFVPTIIINGVYSKENQNLALNNFAQLICSLLSDNEKISTCSTL
ncbi:PREDICTED: gamma-interferon-inducible lysosomal thiol reductase-like [Polistes canadensis]|uniref:gamma-interferon-inducible lysosomal thiol reductase-like n=1 Tax=Polistes canadensis TaxID=91411 RepID=UPI000718C8D7|nr:PREDICTED: gamma-interferon-inducible lysosomal thiol reductase-like [Polistes canadensis]